MIDLPMMGGPPPRPTFSKPWIPPAGLIMGQLAHGLSWLLLLSGAWRGGSLVAPHPFMPALAWVHLVGLGWITLTALSVLVHVVPAFFDVKWRAEAFARWSLLPFALGTGWLVLGFLGAQVTWLPWAGSLIFLGLVGFMGPATVTILSYRPPAGSTAPLRTGVLGVLWTAVLALSLGWLLALALGGGPSVQSWSGGALLQLLALPVPSLHALLAIGGWITLLIFGVSRNTIRPLVRIRGLQLRYHGAASAALAAGVLALSVGLFVPAQPLVLGLAWLAVAAGVGLYAFEIGSLVRRSTSDHRPPLAFVAATLVYLCGATLLGAGVLLGQTAWQAPMIFLALAGWAGQSINGYALHVGVRLLATMARGDQDETRPVALLSASWSWTAFAALQLAIVLGALGLGLGTDLLVQLAGGLGLGGWVIYLANVRRAWQRASIKG